MVFPALRSMTELLIPIKFEKRKSNQKGFANLNAKYKYLKLSKQIGKEVKRSRVKRIIAQSMKKVA